MRNIKLLIEYDGTDFVGWQVQPKGRTVQGEITGVLSRVLQEPISLIGAGRTDTGVHARGQVANFRTVSTIAPDALLRALGGMLSDDVVVHSVDEVPETFHARYDARERVYRYYISFRSSAIGRSYRWHMPYRLDLELMKAAALGVEGTHDFESFSKNGSEVDHYRCHVKTSRWKQDGENLVYEICADRFMRGMVRLLVGTMVDVGRGHQSLDSFQQLLEERDRSKSGMAAPPHGLFLEEVLYGGR